MQKDHKDELILMLKRKNAEIEEKLKQANNQMESIKKGESGNEQKMKAMQEMHAAKIKTLLKSINNLKKEVRYSNNCRFKNESSKRKTMSELR